MTFELPKGIRGHGWGVDGMLTVPEGEFLAEKATGKTVLELGSWCGLSTIVMARVAKEVWSVDWGRGDQEMGSHNTLPELWRNLRALESELCPVVVVAGRFERVLPRLRSEQFQMVYIDGSHDAASVSLDTEHAMRLVKAGGTVVWHDGNRPHVLEAASRASGLKPQIGPDRMIWADL